MNLLKKINGEWIVPILLLGYATYYYIEVRSLPNPEVNMLLIKPVYFILLGSVTLFLLTRLYMTWKQSKGESVQEKENAQNESLEKLDVKKTLSFAITTIFYVFLIEHIGFMVTTILYMIILGFLIGIRSKLTLILVPTILVITLYIVFEIWLNLSLPKGILI